MKSIHIVGGAPRSGTTMLQAVLADAEDAVPLMGESRFVKHLLAMFREINETWDDDAHYYFEHPKQARDFASGAIHHVFGEAAARWRGLHFVTKTPEYSRYPDEIESLLPESVRYVTMRDPKDIVALQLLALRREAELGHRLSIFGDNKPDGDLATVRALAERLLEYYPPGVFGGNWQQVSYEAFVRHPAAGVRRLAGVSGLNITFDPDRTWKNVEFDYLRSSRTVERAWSSELWGTPISAGRVGVHRDVLVDEQGALVDEICADYLAIWTELNDLT